MPEASGGRRPIGWWFVAAGGALSVVGYFPPWVAFHEPAPSSDLGLYTAYAGALAIAIGGLLWCKLVRGVAAIDIAGNRGAV